MFVIIAFARFLIYLLASETKQYFGIETNNNLFTILYYIKKMFLMETFVKSCCHFVTSTHMDV